MLPMNKRRFSSLHFHKYQSSGYQIPPATFQGRLHPLAPDLPLPYSLPHQMYIFSPVFLQSVHKCHTCVVHLHLKLSFLFLHNDASDVYAHEPNL